MTVVVSDGKTMCADSRMSVGSEVQSVSCRKLHRIGQSVVGFAGAIGIAYAVIAWLEALYAGEEVGEYPDKDGEALLLILHPNGEINMLDGAGHEFPAGNPVAIGSGGTIAVTALRCGLSIKDAVKMAVKYDCFCGGKVRSKQCG